MNNSSTDQATTTKSVGNLSPHELLGEIIKKGYQRAASSFSTMIGLKVTTGSNQVNMVSDRSAITDRFNERQHITMIVTSIIGQLRGESYLLLTAAEEDIICEMSRKAFGGGTTLQNELVLKEIDNIISAAVITEFSNQLSLKIYGDVPHLYHLKDREIWKSSINFSDTADDFFVVANANFEFPAQMSISPSFIWRFEKKVLSFIEENRNKIQSA